MSPPRQTTQDQLKHSKSLFPPAEKTVDRPAILIRGALVFFIFNSLGLIFFSAFYAEYQWARSAQCGGGAANISSTLRGGGGGGGGDGDLPTNLSHIVFGIAGSVNTWPNRRRYSELWWCPNRTRGFVWLDRKPWPRVSSWPETSPPYRVSEDWTRFKHSSSRASVRIARILLEAFRVGLPDVRWFVMGDDDTVFFPDNLVSALSRYDHRQMYYVGAASESVEQNEMHAYDMAFGGGGFAISYALAAELARVLDGCIDRYYTLYGSDERVWACVSELGVPLTREPGFHQVDIADDPYGLLAAHPVAPLVSLHHLDYISPLFPSHTRLDSVKSLMLAYQADPSRIVQQAFCYSPKRNVTISVSWGYTAQIYPSMVAANKLQRPLQTFWTWRTWSDGPFAFNTRPMSPNLCEQPVIYFLDKVVEIGQGKTVTSYRQYVHKDGNRCGRANHALALAVKRIVVSARIMDPQDWNKAPRRQCCQIIEKSRKKRVLRLSIRKCKLHEKSF